MPRWKAAKEKKEKRGREGEKRREERKGKELTCCHLFAGSLAESAAVCPHRESF